MIKKGKVRLVNHSIANTFGRGKGAYIEINKNLKEYPNLYKNILKHELGHVKRNGVMDFWYEIKEVFNYKNYVEIFKFQIKHPLSFLQLSPIIISKKGFVLDSFLIMFYTMIIVGVIGLTWGI